MDAINIAVAINDNYAQHLGVMLYSLFDNNREAKFRVFVLNSFITGGSIELLNKIAYQFSNEIQYKKVDIQALTKFKADKHVTIETYFRILLPLSLPKHINKVLYLDTDIIVKRDVTELWNTDICDYLLAGVRDVTTNRNSALDIPAAYAYFNAGVMLVNLAAWRRNNTVSKCLSFIRVYPEKIKYWDQDALNAVLYDQWLPLHPKYNMQGPLFMDEFVSYFGDPHELKEAINHPVIIHYSAPQKPWHYLSYHPYTQEYFKYLALTPWRDYRPDDKTPIRVIRKATRPYLKKVGITKVFGKCLY